MTTNSRVLIIVEIDNQLQMYATTKLITHLFTLRKAKEVKLIGVYRKYYMWSDSYEKIANQVRKQIELKIENLEEIEALIEKLNLQKIPIEFYDEFEEFDIEQWKKFATEINATSLINLTMLFVEPICKFVNKLGNKYVVYDAELPLIEQNLRGEYYYDKQYDDIKLKKINNLRLKLK